MRASRTRIMVASFVFGILCQIVPLSAQNVTITQIDSSRLLSMQTVRLFLDIALPPGQGSVTSGKFAVSESSDGKTYTDVNVRSLTRSANKDEGISFYFLLDNSGSMWDDLSGKPTEILENTRIAHAKKALKEFVSALSAQDRAGLSVFNTNYHVVREISSDASGISGLIDGIEKPSRDEAYTELYGSIQRSLTDFGETGRRKVLLILSDGENFPFDIQKSTVTAQDGIDEANKEGITCYAVNFGNVKDPGLPQVAALSGGMVFDARNSEELLGIYNSIRANILDEYALTYTASMLPGDKRYVRVTYPLADGFSESVRYYYSGTVLGSNTQAPQWYYVLFFIIPLFILLFFILFKLEKETTEAGIQLLYGAKNMHTKAFTLTGQQTIIGGAATADITLSGNPALKGNAATIVFDKTKKRYSITADSDLTVNNKPVTTRILEPGDVINMSGTVVVFDDVTKK